MADFDLISLELLVHIDEATTLSGGAELSNMTASGASQRIAKLEQLIGQPVLERLPRGVRLTDAGEVLAQRARLIRQELRSASGELEAIKGLERGSVRLGSFPTASASMLSDALKQLHARWPAIDVRVQSALRPKLLDMLAAGEIDLAVLWSYAWTEETASTFAQQLLTTDATRLLVAADSSIEDGVRLRSLAAQRWITRNGGHPASDALYRSCERVRMTPEVVYEAYDYQEVQAMVAAGVGVAMVPSLAVRWHRSDVRVVAFDARDRVPSRNIYLASVNRRRFTPAMRAVADTIVRVAEGESAGVQ